jgi:hypothetical protein
MDPFAGFTVVQTHDRSVQVVPDPTPATVVETHTEHVRVAAARRHARPVAHDDRDHALRLSTQAADHQTRIQRRLVTMSKSVNISLVVLIGAVFIYLELAYAVSLATALALDALMVALIAVVLVLSGTAMALGPARWWRPSYRLGGSA